MVRTWEDADEDAMIVIGNAVLFFFFFCVSVAEVSNQQGGRTKSSKKG